MACNGKHIDGSDEGGKWTAGSLIADGFSSGTDGKVVREGLETGERSWLKDEEAWGDEWRLDGDIIETGDDGEDDLDVTQPLIIASDDQLIGLWLTWGRQSTRSVVIKTFEQSKSLNKSCDWEHKIKVIVCNIESDHNYWPYSTLIQW